MAQRVVVQHSDLIELVGSNLLNSLYYPALQFDNPRSAYDFVAELTLAALFDIFPSIPADIGCTYEELFIRHADHDKLFALAVKHGIMDYEEITVYRRSSTTRKIVEDTVKVKPGLADLCYAAFDGLFCDFRQGVEDLLTVILGEFNPYAEVTYRIENELHVITLGEDIRFKVFRELYGERYVTGKYRK